MQLFLKAAFLLLAFFHTHSAFSQLERATSMVGEKLPDLAFKTLTGDSVYLHKLQGWIVVLNLFFRQCPHCVVETPFLNSLTAAYQDRSKIVFIAISSRDDSAQLVKFFKQNPFNYTVIPSPYPAKGKAWTTRTYYALLEKYFRTTTYPTNIVADQQGRITYYNYGFTKGKTDLALTEAIKKLISNDSR